MTKGVPFICVTWYHRLENASNPAKSESKSKNSPHPKTGERKERKQQSDPGENQKSKDNGG